MWYHKLRETQEKLDEQLYILELKNKGLKDAEIQALISIKKHSEKEIQIKREKESFRGHLLAYVMVNASIIGVFWLFTGKYPIWSTWVILGWGIGLLFHYLQVQRIK